LKEFEAGLLVVTIQGVSTFVLGLF
jgi:hypothetical protein